MAAHAWQAAWHMRIAAAAAAATPVHVGEHQGHRLCKGGHLPNSSQHWGWQIFG